MKHLILLSLLASSTVWADRVQLSCSFKENNRTQNFNITGNRDNSGNFELYGSHSNVSVSFSYSRQSGRTMNVFVNGQTNSISLSGSGKMSYPMGGVGGMALSMMGMNSGERKIKVECDPRHMMLVPAPAPVVIAPASLPEPVRAPVTPVNQPSITPPPAIVSAPATIMVLNVDKDYVSNDGVNLIQDGEFQPLGDMNKPYCGASHTLSGLEIEFELLSGTLEINRAYKSGRDGFTLIGNQGDKKIRLLCRSLPQPTLEEALKVLRHISVVDDSNKSQASVNDSGRNEISEVNPASSSIEVLASEQ